ncbi:MAG: hypothetical protein ACI8VI_001881, partial [Granulosicoccus sp.]
KKVHKHEDSTSNYKSQIDRIINTAPIRGYGSEIPGAYKMKYNGSYYQQDQHDDYLHWQTIPLLSLFK